ncbi:MAG: MotA/TolQ/ExbB proton channel family protein [Bdellovibrionales bacterium]
MIKTRFIFLFLIFPLLSFGEDTKIKTLNDLFKKVQQDQIEQRPELKKRELKFLKLKNQQRVLLNRALLDLKKQEQIMLYLQAIFDQQEKQLSDLENRLNLAAGTLGELFGVFKQNSRNLKNQIEVSLISSQYKNRQDFLKEISLRKKLPNIEELKQFWLLIQQEMTEAGRVVEFQGSVLKPNGKIKSQSIVRVGAFNLISEGKYVDYESETSQIVEFQKQPSRRFLSLAKRLETSKKSHEAFGLDPSRGALLALFMKSPNLFQRIHQGGLVGYLIILLLIFSLIFSGERFWKLRRQEQLLNLQIKSSKILKNNPLGEIQQVFESNKNKSTEVLELKMEEVIGRQTSHIQKGLSTLKVLASIAPLLGLLGTVTGMIGTFQSITLFGTGDPKLMAGGISQALVTTVLGLISAIPLILIYNYLSTKAQNLVQIFENESLGFLSEKQGGK